MPNNYNERYWLTYDCASSRESLPNTGLRKPYLTNLSRRHSNNYEAFIQRITNLSHSHFSTERRRHMKTRPSELSTLFLFFSRKTAPNKTTKPSSYHFLNIPASLERAPSTQPSLSTVPPTSNTFILQLVQNFDTAPLLPRPLYWNSPATFSRRATLFI